jgi:PilZ domain
MQPVMLKTYGVEIQGRTANVGLHGVFGRTVTPIELGTEVEITIFLPNGLRTRSAGRVVRVDDRPDSEGTFGFAVECTKPFSEPERPSDTNATPIH